MGARLLPGDAQHPELGGLNFRQISDRLGKDPWDCYLDILADAGADYEAILTVGTLFTDEHLAEMIGHPLFCLGVDTFTVQDSGPLSEIMKHPLGFAGHVHYLTHHVREQGTLRLEEAIRKMTSMPAAHFGLWDRGLLRSGYSADVVVFDWDELDDVSTRENPTVYAHGIEHVLVNGVLVVDDAEHTGARPGPSPAAAVKPEIDLRSDLHAAPTDEMWEAMRSAKLGWATVGEDPSVNELQERMAALLGKEAAIWVPTCGMANLVALLTIAPRGSTVVLEASSHVLTSEEMGIEEIAGVEPWSLWAADGRLDPVEVEEAIVETGATMLLLENTHTRAGGTVLTPERTAELAAAAQRHGAYVHLDGARLFNAAVALGVPLRGARVAGEHGGGQHEQGAVRADGDDPGRPHAGDRARTPHPAPARRGERAQGGDRRRGGARRARHARRAARRRPSAGAGAGGAAPRDPGHRDRARRDRDEHRARRRQRHGALPGRVPRGSWPSAASWAWSATRAASASSPTA